jgi:hypothetical protein
MGDFWQQFQQMLGMGGDQGGATSAMQTSGFGQGLTNPGSTVQNQGGSDWSMMQNLFGGKNADGAMQTGFVSPAMGAIGSGIGAWTGMQNAKMGKKLINSQIAGAQQDRSNQAALTNQSLGERNDRALNAGKTTESTEDYLKRVGIS